jgi:hypothetical protein
MSDPEPLLLPKGIPAYVRWGVGDPAALDLMSKGMLSRTLATRISSQWKVAETDQDVFSWLRTLEINDWRRLFSATITELRLLLDFCRKRKGGPAVEFLNSGSTSIEVESQIETLTAGPATLHVLDESELSPIGIWVAGQLVGKIGSRDQADLQAIISSGLDYSTVYSAESGSGVLRINLENS